MEKFWVVNKCHRTFNEYGDSEDATRTVGVFANKEDAVKYEQDNYFVLNFGDYFSEVDEVEMVVKLR
jgi:hypothetical protein